MKETTRGKTDAFDLETLLHPANAFSHPMDVVRDLDLTLKEKRAILASWASVEAAPKLRVTRSGRLVHWDDIMDALQALDRDGGKPLPHYKRVLAKRDAGLRAARRFRWRNRNDRGRPLN